MTEKRLRQIAYEQGFDRSTMEGNNVHPRVLELLKVAVNEAIEECADKADVKQNTAFKYVWEVDIDKLLNLKVK